MDGLFQCARADAMDYADLGAIREVGLIEELLELAQGVTGAHPDEVELIAVVARSGDGDARFVCRGARRSCPPDPICRDLDP